MYARLRNLVRRTAEKGCLALMIWCVLLLGGAGAGSAFGQIPCGGYDYITWPNMNCGFGPFPGTPVALNVHGHVTGHFIWCGDPQYRTFLWTGGPTTTVLPLPAGYKAMRAEAMNDLTEIVGSLRSNAGTSRAFLRRANGEVIDLGLPPGAIESYATGINNKSEISGYATGGGSKAFVWRDGSFTMLDLPIGPSSRAMAINDVSQITGWMGSAVVGSVGFLWQNGKVVSFGPLPGDTTMFPSGLSSGGRVTGWSRFSAEAPHGFIFYDGSLVDLGFLPGHTQTIPRSCNDLNVVGTCEYTIGRVSGSTGFIWSNKQMVRLADLVPIPNIDIYTVAAITSDGRIACTGQVGGTHYGLILTPAKFKAGDVTNDCHVNVNDLLTVINEWGPCGKVACDADLNGDGIVNLSDLTIVIENWDTS